MDDKKEAMSSPASNLFALECLATTAGKLHESEKQKQETKDSGNIVKSDEKTNKVSVLQMAPMTEPVSIPSSITPFTSFYPTFQNPTSVKPFPDFTIPPPPPPPFSQAPFRNFLDVMPPITGASFPKSDGVPWKSTTMHSNTTTSEMSKRNPDLHLSTEPAKSAFDIVPKNTSSNSIPHPSISNAKSSGYEPVVSNPLSSNANIPQQPPMLFRIDQPNNNSLLETLVQESQKILKAQDNFQGPQLTSLKTLNSGSDKFFTDYESSKKETEQASKTNDDFKRAREMVLISPQKKTMRKQRTGLHSVGDVKRAYGGPPFKPGYAPPQVNTPESATCCLYEHTLLKMATRGFWSGDRGPLQDVFRLTRVENSDLQYNMKEITQHCYNVVKRKLEFADGEKDMMQKHMRNYVDEFDG